jgi:proteasome beta subunit
VALPLFAPGEDPGPDFAALLQRSGRTPAVPRLDPSAPPLSVPHATTVVALRFAGGIVMAGDRRATEGHSIAHRAMEKVFPADRWSAVAIAGAAGPAVEMVRLFQVQLEHYEKVEGLSLSLEGKANQLAQMVRSHLPMAMQGLVVVPLFAGYDQQRATGRIYTYDVTGGHYEETDFQATGSGGRDARNTVKLGYRDDMTRDEAVELAIEALFEAADEDAGTGGPDLVRGIYPLVAVVDVDGYAPVSEAEVAERFAAVIERQRERRQPADTTAGARRGPRGGRSR